MPEDEFRTDLQWPIDPLGERQSPPPDSAPVSPGTLTHEVVAEELDRLSDRLIEVLQALRSDLDADLDDVRAEVAGVRRLVDEVRERPPLPGGPSQPPPSLEPVLEELATVREELISLKHRIGLRAKAQADAAVLTDEQIDRIARTVAERLSIRIKRARW
jgi:hypothetical protein